MTTTSRAKIVEMLRSLRWVYSKEAADLIEQDGQRIAAMEEEVEILKVNLSNAQDAMRGPLAWLETWARHIGNCNGNEGCTCGLTFMRHELRTFSRRDHEEVGGEE